MTTINTPTGLTAVVENGNSVRLNWTDNATNEQNYLIERKVSGGEWALLTVVGASVVTYLDTTVSADTGYYYRVRGRLVESNAYIYVDKFAGGWSAPECIRISSDGTYLWLSDTGAHRVRKYLRESPYTHQSYIGSTSGSGDGQFNTPRGVADSGSYIFVCDSANHRIQKFTTGGTYDNKVGSQGTGNDQFNNPCGIVVSGSNIFVTDRDNHRVHKRSTSGAMAYVDKFGSSGSGDGQFNEPYGIDVDSNYIYVCDKNNNRVQIFNIASPFAYVGQFGSLNKDGVAGSISDDGRLSQPVNIKVYGSKLYVTDRGNSRIQIFQSTAPYTYLGKTGTNGTGNGQFATGGLSGIDVNSTKIYAIDKEISSAVGRVTIFNNS